MLAENFEDGMVLQQLRSSSTLAYANLVRFGFPSRLSLECIQNLYSQHYHICAGRRQFHMKLLLSNDFRIGDFKLGNNYIFFRSNKHDQIQQLLSVESSVRALKKYIARTRWLILFMFFVKCFKESKYYLVLPNMS